MDTKPKTSEANGRLWGARARDWADIQEAQHGAAYDAILPRLVKRGTRYLDAGCGSGMAAQIAAKRGAKVSGIDAAENLLAIARERVPDGDFRVGDLETLPFPDRAFDLVTGFNSFQYAANPAAALAEARRVTKRRGLFSRAGRVVIMVWGPPANMPAASLVTALGPVLPPPPPGAPGPFALSDEKALRALATSAGLRPRKMVDAKGAFRYPDLATALRGLGSSGVATRAIAHSGEEAVNEAHTKALAPFRKADGSYEAAVLFRCLICSP